MQSHTYAAKNAFGAATCSAFATTSPPRERFGLRTWTSFGLRTLTGFGLVGW